ncbi:MAG TPA: hypothetical protein VEZ70_02895 [Allosphingosinicella sp.]|nr:hypothetical protein [Allosphingosinicella sp.]
MPFVGLIVLLQVACVVHCVRQGRSGLWIMAVIAFPLLGSLAYGWFEILPAYRGRREVRAVTAAAANRIDPDREVREARDALEIADTAANHIKLGDAFAEREQWREAARQYRDALGRLPGGEDRAVGVKLARAELESGNAATARDLLLELPPSRSGSENDRTALLLARSHDEAGEPEPALALYAGVGDRLSGGEAQCRQAALLIRLNRTAEAVPLLEEAERRATRMDRFERAKDRDMYDWAARTLAELRSGGGAAA